MGSLAVAVAIFVFVSSIICRLLWVRLGPTTVVVHSFLAPCAGRL